uniref:Putative ovule protein n=1 Tax=Solanum chacoense TaxID=4108 RepID=A0A0V0GKF6_SOLCH
MHIITSPFLNSTDLLYSYSPVCHFSQVNSIDCVTSINPNFQDTTCSADFPTLELATFKLRCL